MTENLTRTERRIFNLLADGRPHTVQEIRNCLDDPLLETSTARIHIMRMRRKIRVEGAGIMYEKMGGNGCYRLVRHITTT